MSNPKYTTKSETEKVFSVFDSFQKDAEKTQSAVNEDIRDDQPVLTMSSLGKLGRFGNQLFQYTFLRICAEKSGARVECPPWIGQTLFGHNDPPISKRLPPAIERSDMGKNLFDFIPEFIPYLEKLADAKSWRISSEALDCGLSNVDLWGFFQFHTRYFKPHQQYFRSLFQPVSDLKSALEDGLNLLRSKGKTIVCVHIRRGDYIKQPRTRFTLVFPSKLKSFLYILGWHSAWKTPSTSS
ncbi:MAG: alpha-1,2-fucosyltransferase [Cyanobacteria bacterium J06592_8]